MILLTIAHKGEAQAFISRKHNLAVDFYFTDVYRHEDEILLLTGSGKDSITERVAFVLRYFGDRISEVLNFGIAGALNDQLQINQIYGVKEICPEYQPTQERECYVTANLRGQVICVSASRPVLTDEHAAALTGFADVVDMETWHIAQVCKKMKVPFKSYKLISDYAGSKTDTRAIRKNAATFSRHLFDFYKKLPDRGK